MFATLELPIRDDGRHKRLQGGRACHPCRVKKIKCDGKHPCMQCKARQRECVFLKNSDETYIRLDTPRNPAVAADTSLNTDGLFTGGQSKTPPPSDAGLSQPHNRTDKMVEQLTESLMQLSMDHQRGYDWDGNVTPWNDYGRLARWTLEPGPPSTYSVTVEMPPQQTQERLVDLFFDQCTLFPTTSRHMFYDQLQSRGNLVTPLLLNAMYALAARMDPLHQKQSATYYNRARHLLDDFLDVPRLSTVIALLHMATYNDSIHTSRAWMYSGMAVRMCLDLGLHTANYSSQMSQFDIELRRRVLWTCYVMDKLESFALERPCMLPLKDVSLDLPSVLPEDRESERYLLRGFVHLCQLLALLEKIVVFVTKDAEARRSNLWTEEDEKQTIGFLDEIGQWRDMLPKDLAIPLSIGDATPMVANLHLLCYDVELFLFSSIRSRDTRPRRQELVRIIIQLVSLMVQDRRSLYSPTLAIFSGTFVALTLIRDLRDPDMKMVEETTLLFRQCLESVRILLPMTSIRDLNGFTRLLDMALQPIPTSVNVSCIGLSSGTVAYAQHAFAALADLFPKNPPTHLSQPNPIPHNTASAPAPTPPSTVAPTPVTPAPYIAHRRRYPTVGASHPYTFEPEASYLQAANPTGMSSATMGSNPTPPPTTTAVTSIEPADYTFELISIGDEWTRALNSNYPPCS